MKNYRRFLSLFLAVIMVTALVAVAPAAQAKKQAIPDFYTFPLEEKAEIGGLTNFPAGSEAEPSSSVLRRRPMSTSTGEQSRVTSGAIKSALRCPMSKLCPSLYSTLSSATLICSSTLSRVLSSMLKSTSTNTCPT